MGCVKLERSFLDSAFITIDETPSIQAVLVVIVCLKQHAIDNSQQITRARQSVILSMVTNMHPMLP